MSAAKPTTKEVRHSSGGHCNPCPDPSVCKSMRFLFLIEITFNRNENRNHLHTPESKSSKKNNRLAGDPDSVVFLLHLPARSYPQGAVLKFVISKIIHRLRYARSSPVGF